MKLFATLMLGMVLIAAPPTSPDPHPDWNKIAAQVEHSIVRLDFVRHVEDMFGERDVPSACTAFSIKIDGTFATAAHCVQGFEHHVGEQEINVLLQEGDLDVAVFRVAGLYKPALTFITRDAQRAQQVMTLGYGYGQSEPILRLAYVSNVSLQYETEPIASITFDNGFVGGQSGSPVVDANSQVVTIATQSDEYSGWGRPTADLRKALKKYL